MNDMFGFFLGGAFLAVGVFVALRNGEWGIGPRGAAIPITREDLPVFFWLGVGVFAAASGYCFFRFASLALQHVKL